MGAYGNLPMCVYLVCCLHSYVKIDILSQYISCVRALDTLDSHGFIVHAVVAPIREYLRQRPDTVRVIVNALLDDSSSGLLQELEDMVSSYSGERAHIPLDGENDLSDFDDDSDADDDGPAVSGDAVQGKNAHTHTCIHTYTHTPTVFFLILCSCV